MLPIAIPEAWSIEQAATWCRAGALERDRIRIDTLNVGWTDTPREHLVQTRVHNRPDNWLEVSVRRSGSAA